MAHPGEILQEKLNISGMSRKELAIRTNVTEKHICTIVNGDKGISSSFANKLGYVFENAGFWLNLQAEYDAEQSKLQEQNEISDDEIALLKPLQEITNYFIEKNYIHNNCGDVSKVMQLRDFLKISDLTLIPKITYNAAYRAQLSSNIKVDPYVLFAWQRLCEKETEGIKIKEVVDKKLLAENTNRIKKLMFGNINKGLEEYRATPGAILADVRKADEFRFGHIPGAINAPLSTITNTILPKDAPLFLYCLRGTRSKRAVGILKKMGYTVKSIGGISGYKGEVER